MKVLTATAPAKALVLCLALAALTLGGCASNSTKEQPAQATDTPAANTPARPVNFATPIEKATNYATWAGKEALQFDLVLKFGGRTRVNGTITMLTNTGKVRIQLKDSLKTAMIWDGTKAVITPAASEAGGARFAVLTWPYFLAAPFKLNDPGTTLAELPQGSIGDTKYARAKLTFGSGVGDSPNDWYVLYRNPSTNLLDAMAYIVTYSSPQEEAEQDPHAIRYESYTTVEGVQIPNRWSFWNWKQDVEFEGQEQLGSAELSNIKFVTPNAKVFAIPTDHRVDALPGT